MRLFRQCFFVFISMYSLSVNAFSFSDGFFELFVGDGSSEDQSAYLGQNNVRILAWQQLIKNNQTGSDWQKINTVNQFFNQVAYKSDVVQWGVEDYWASPQEFLSKNAGDCEDYSIAKYFTLKALGISEDKLRMTYVSVLPTQQAHMVLVYLEGDLNEVSLVLDNLSDKIQTLAERNDLDPIYGFNNKGLWLALAKWEAVEGGVQQVSAWQTLTQKMKAQQVL